MVHGGAAGGGECAAARYAGDRWIPGWAPDDEGRSKRESSESGAHILHRRLVRVDGRTPSPASATTERRALSEAWMPAFEMVTVCCSITWRKPAPRVRLDSDEGAREGG